MKEFLSRHRRVALYCIDVITLLATYCATLNLYFYNEHLQGAMSVYISSSLALIGVYTLGFVAFRLYDSLWRYAESYEFIRCTLVSLGCGAVFSVVMKWMFPRYTTISLAAFVIVAATLALLLSRMVYRLFVNHCQNRHRKRNKRTLIVGAGQAANLLIQEIEKNASSKLRPVCCVDDDPQKHGRMLHNVKIEGATQDIPALCREHKIGNIYLAIPSASHEEQSRILTICSKCNAKIKILPGIMEVMTAENDLFSHVRDVKIEDLLGRDQVQFDTGEIASFIAGKTVLVTGGGGSIGSELCRQIAQFSPKRLIVLDIYENNAYDIQQELTATYGDSLDLCVQIASVRDFNKMCMLFRTLRPEVVFHAAAHKHVPLMEGNPEEAVKNNVIGTFYTAFLADTYQAQKFVLISTDKAVNPTNIMGATKRMCEMIVQLMSQHSKTEFAAVRFGNVLGSNGSVIPLFKKQIEAGGPVKVTHPDIIRYFMTIPEAVSLVLEAGRMAKGGEIFVLDMGKPVKIADLAYNLIRLSGLIPDVDVKVEYTGLRPGEKLYEELLMDEEGLQKTSNQRIFIGQQIPVDAAKLIEDLSEMRRLASQNRKKELIEKIIEVVPTYHRPEESCGCYKAFEMELDESDYDENAPAVAMPHSRQESSVS